MTLQLHYNHLTIVLQGILLPAIHDGETFSFCMCNPPFFGTIQEAGRNPHTAYAGDLLASPMAPLTNRVSLFHWFTFMLGHHHVTAPNHTAQTNAGLFSLSAIQVPSNDAVAVFYKHLESCRCHLTAHVMRWQDVSTEMLVQSHEYSCCAANVLYPVFCCC